MTRAKSNKIGSFNFVNWPEKAARLPLSDHSASVVDNFISTLTTGSAARAVSLEVSSDSITLVRRKRKARVAEPFIVNFDVFSSCATEHLLASVLSKDWNRELLREIVEAASGRLEFDAKFAGKMIANAVFTAGIGL